MSYTSVLGEMQTIQARLVQAGILQAATPAKAATSKVAAASFAVALTDATATSATLGAAPTSSATASTAATTATTATASTASTDGTTIDASGVTGDDVVEAALTYKGTPYVLGGESKSGIDCSGLVQASFAKLGVSVPRLVHEQETVGQKVDSLKDAKPGDLIVLNGGDHIAIYMGNDTVIHAPYAGRTVSVQKAWFDDSDITTIRRIVPATDDAGTTASTTGTGSTDTAATNSNGLSLATVARATALLGMFGADAGLSNGSADSSSSDSSSSLSSLLSSFGITGSTSGTDSSASLLASLGLSGTTSSTSTTSAATQQILAARAAMYGTSA